MTGALASFNMRPIGVFFVIISLVLPAWAKTPERVVKIGVIAPLAGSSAVIGDEITRTVNLVADGLKHRSTRYSYQFLFEDGRAGVDSASTTALRKLTDLDDVRFFIVATSGEILQVGHLAERLDLLMIAPYATAPAVSKLGQRIFRTAINFERGADLLASYIRKRGDLPLALLTEEHAFTWGVSDALRKQLLNDIASNESYPLDESDLRTVLLRARAKHPKAYYFSCARPITCAAVIKQARTLGITEQIYSFLHMSDPDFLRAARSDANGVRFLSSPDQGNQSPRFIEFQRKYREQYQSGPGNDFLQRSTYDAVNAVIDGIEAVGASPSEVSRYLHGYEVEGALGLVRFDASGDIEDLNYVLKEIADGSITTPSG
ncbi:MAG: hypothetical protein DCC75_05570 [Proteobacteria bacterium]|nr:MAG: hypothetical protein DCC75_05570 [Pseudomonadota bacterium]